jgi:alpha-galactosidase
MPAKKSKSISISSGPARLTFHPDKGAFDIVCPSAGCRISAATAAVAFAHEPRETVTLAGGNLLAFSLVEGTLSAVYRFRGFDLDIAFAPAPRPGAFEVNFAYTNTSGREVPVRALLPLCSTPKTKVDLGLKDSSVRVYRNGFSGWAPSNAIGLLEPHTEYPEDDSFWGASGDVEVKGLVRSSLVTQVRCKGAYLTIGFLSASRQFGMLSVAARGASGPALSAAAIADAKPITSGRRYAAEPLYVSFADDYARALTDYASLLAEHTDARRPPEQPTGWCSWYCYGDAVTESDCLENLRWLSERRHALGFRVFQIDDGWQTEVGDWLEANVKFSRGMKALADDVRAAGLTPGLWFAPFIASSTSALSRRHPDWLVKDRDGSPKVFIRNWNRDVYALDLTNPKVLSHVAQFTSRICFDWGYDYIKADFLDAGAVEGRRHDNTKTRAQNYRRGLEILRQVAGPDKYILACNAPLGGAIGLVDGARVSQDVGPNWSGGLSVLSASWALTKFWTHNLLWQNDPDCLLVRDGGTPFSPVEARTLANMILMSGGSLMVSEKMSALSDSKIAALAKFFPVSTTAAVPLDLYERTRPAIYFAAGKRILLGAFNWEERHETFSLNPRKILGPLPVTSMADFWTGEKSPVPSGKISVTLAPHQSLVWEFA